MTKKANNNVQVDRSHYSTNKYDKVGRFISYWHQIEAIRKLCPRTTLEIGKGNGLVSDYLSKLGLQVVTLDYDIELRPQVVGSVLSLPFPNSSFDVVSCCQVLEHLPFTSFASALREIQRVTSRFVVISLPNFKRVYRFVFELPKMGLFRFHLPSLQFPPRKHKFKGQHYWEIGKRGYPVGKVVREIESCNLKLIDKYRVFDNPYHHFFILEKLERAIVEAH